MALSQEIIDTARSTQGPEGEAFACLVDYIDGTDRVLMAEGLIAAAKEMLDQAEREEEEQEREARIRPVTPAKWGAA